MRESASDPKRLEAEAFGVVWEKAVTVVVRFRADQAPYVREREWHPTRRLRELRDGRVESPFRVGGMFEIMPRIAASEGPDFLSWAFGRSDSASCHLGNRSKSHAKLTSITDEARDR